MTRVLSAIPILLLAGCLFREDEDPVEPIVPLASGNTWAYVDSAFFGPDSVRVDSTHIDILGERVVTLNGVAHTTYLWNVRDRATGEPGEITLFVRNGDDGEYTVGAARGGGEAFFETLHVKHPGKKGERYTTYFIDVGLEDGNGVRAPVLDTVEIEIAAVDTTCVTPAGTFHCSEYRGSRAGVEFARTWYAPGVGYLGSEVFRTLEIDGESRQVRFRKQLARYTLN
jgi:hypothetical protein